MAANFQGAEKHFRRLQGMRGRARREAERLVYRLADEHVVEAAFLITEGSVSGDGHVASLPGEPPNADTGTLDRSGHVRGAGPLKADSVFDAPYAAKLEFGDETVIERPFMGPAAKTIRKRVERLAAEAVRRIVGGLGGI